MRLDLVVRADGRAVPVTVEAEEGATLGDLRRALAELAGPAFGACAADATPLIDAGLLTGATIEAGDQGAATVRVEPAGALEAAIEAAVVGGLHAGITRPLTPGDAVPVGRAARGGLLLPDPEVSRAHARLRAAEDGSGVTVSDAGSANGIRFGAWRLDGELCLRDDQVVGLGESVLAVRRPSGGDAELTPDAGGGTRLFNRPPRIRVPGHLPELVVPSPPERPGGLRLPWAATLLPLVLCGALYFVLPRGYAAYLLLMMALSPLLAVVTLVGDRRSGRREYARARSGYETARAAFEAEVACAVAVEELAERAAYPDPAALVRRTGAGGAAPASTLWQRRPADLDFLRLRVGLADRDARLVLRHEPAAAARVTKAEREPPPTVRDVPATVDLTDAGVLGVAGPRAMTLAVARALITQAAVLHSPAELGLVLITGRDTAADWEWATWLPHTLPASSAFACVRMVATDAVQAEARLTELRRLVDERLTEQRSALVQGPPPGRALLVVLDGARRLRDLPGLGELLATGPGVGVRVLCLDAEETALADECGATLVAATSSGSRVTLRRTGRTPVAGVLADGLVAEAAEAAARALAPLRLLGERGGDSALPDRVDFLGAAGLDPVTPAAVAGRWRASADGRRTTTLLGHGPNGPVTVDLRRDGPHALVAGTSGAGKSELLQTLVASLASVNTPDALTFVLVDYKGGAAFAACADLPHCVGLITDLDGQLVGRALDSLSAELRRRERLFAAADGAKDIEDYWARTGARLPRLVIVVDEFASLVEELPDFVSGVVGIGMRGRSLGVHVVLATQRPGGAVTADMRANLNLRICLRVTSAAESLDVIDVPDAARIPVRRPGRAYVRAGHGEPTAFQAARVGRPRVPATPGPLVRVTPRRVETLGRATAETAEAGENTARTDLTELVAAVRRRPTRRGAFRAAAPVAAAAARARAPYRGGRAGAGTGGGRGRARRPARRAGAGAVRTRPAAHRAGRDRGHGACGPLHRAPYARGFARRRRVAGRPAPVRDRLRQPGPRVARRATALRCRGGRRPTARGSNGCWPPCTPRSPAAARCRPRAATVRSPSSAPPSDERLPYVVVLLDRLEAFLALYAERDGGRLVGPRRGAAADRAGRGRDDGADHGPVGVPPPGLLRRRRPAGAAAGDIRRRRGLRARPAYDSAPHAAGPRRVDA